jgi:hypothetical protein
MQTQNVSGEAGHSPFTPTQGHLHGEAPKITPAIIEEHITHEAYFSAAQGARMAAMDVVAGTTSESEAVSALEEIQGIPESLHLLTLCVLTLRNGFTVVGKSACASPANFNQEIGQQVARGDAVRQIWPLLGYELRTTLHDQHFHRENGEGMHA